MSFVPYKQTKITHLLIVLLIGMFAFGGLFTPLAHAQSENEQGGCATLDVDYFVGEFCLDTVLAGTAKVFFDLASWLAESSSWFLDRTIELSLNLPMDLGLSGGDPAPLNVYQLAGVPDEVTILAGRISYTDILSSDSAYVLGNSPDYLDYYPVLRRPLDEILNKHNINYLLIDKNYVDLQELNLTGTNIVLEEGNLCLIKR